MYRIAHIADTHIKNLKFHYEYKKVFEQLYEILRKENVDYIVHCGDIAHTKTQISPEFVELCSDFFRKPGVYRTNLHHSGQPRRQPKEQYAPGRAVADCEGFGPTGPTSAQERG